MNRRHIEVIGVDHGWSGMKTVSQVFTTGVKEITTETAFYNNVVEFNGSYYRVGGKRLEVRDLKVEIAFGKTEDILETLVTKYAKELLLNALDELSEDDRIILQLHYNLGLKPKDIGTVLKLSSNTVRMRLVRSRKKLEKILLKEKYKDLIHI